MIYKYSKVITYKDIFNITQEYDNTLKVRTLIIETFDNCRLVFHKHGELNSDYCMYESYLQENLEYDAVWKVVEQYFHYADLMKCSLLPPIYTQQIIDGEE